MKPLPIIMTIGFALFACGVLVWIGKPVSPSTVVEQPTHAETPAETGSLEIPKTGPYGNAVAKETTFDFGTCEQGDRGSHAFVIKNEGEGPLRVKTGKTSCSQCTFGKVTKNGVDVKDVAEVAPGDTVEVEVEWNIKVDQTRFRQTAEVFTTDPKNPRLEFAIVGLVDKTLHLQPEGTWPLGDLSFTEPTVVQGIMFSTLVDEFTIDKYECSNPDIKVTWEQAPPVTIAEKNAKTALIVKVTVPPAHVIGPVRENVKLVTTAKGGTNVGFTLTGRRPGPIEVKGSGWNAENNVISLGEFQAEKGKTAKLTMYVRDLEGPLDVQQQPQENARVVVRVTDSEKSFGKSRIFNVEVEVPPGGPVLRRAKDAEPIVLKLNHPTVNELKIYADYFAK